MSTALVEEFQTQRANTQNIENSILTTRRKLNENLIAVKRIEAALEDIESGAPPTRTFSQAGHAFVAVPHAEMVADLAREKTALQNARTQLTQMEAKLVDRLKAKRQELQALEQKLTAELEASQKQ